MVTGLTAESGSRWLKALRDNHADAHERLRRVAPDASADRGLRTMQDAVARERGFTAGTL